MRRYCKINWSSLHVVQIRYGTTRANTRRWLWATCEVDSCLTQPEWAFGNEIPNRLTYADSGMDVDVSVHETSKRHFMYIVGMLEFIPALINGSSCVHGLDILECFLRQ